MNRFSWSRGFASGLAAFCLAAAALSAWSAGPAGAQGPLEPTERRPLPGVVLTSPPTEVRVRFSARLATPLPSFNAIAVYDRRGERVDLGLSAPELRGTPDPGLLMARLAPLDPGVYTVRWRAAEERTGVAAEGSYTFGLAPRPGSASWAPLLAVGIAGILTGMAIGAWLARLRQHGEPLG